MILGHLTADFVLQPAHLAHWKNRHVTGVLTHCLIHLLTYVFVLLPYIKNSWVLLVVFAVSATHFFVDYARIGAEKKDEETGKYFVLDQIAHLVVLIAAGYLIMMLNIELPEIGFFQKGYATIYPSVIPSVLIILIYGAKVRKLIRPKRP